MKEPIIKIKDLNITYFKGKSNEISALKDVNLEIYPGEFIIFFGPSGCGKSTLLYAIAGLETNIDGDIYINNKNISKLKKGELEIFHQETIGMVFQAYYLINSLTVLKNVILPQFVKRNKNKERKERAMYLLNKFGVDKQANKYPSELSGGQQQRVAISRALINDPEILLADEPVGNLDSKSSDDVMNLFKDLNHKQKRTTILVTHNPSHLNIAHRVFYIKDGKIIDIKENRKVGEELKEKKEVSVSKELALLENTYSNLSTEGAGALLNQFKSREIVSEILTGFTVKEINFVENFVEELLKKGVKRYDELFDYLDKNIKEGGLGLDKRTAKKLTNKIKKVVIISKELREEESKDNSFNSNDIILKVYKYLVEEFEVKIKNKDLENKFSQVIRMRLKNEIDKKTFQKVLNLSISKKGLGIRINTARKIANRLELLILGKYKSVYK